MLKNMNSGTRRMLTRRLLLPLIAAVLVALGGGLEKLGIDLGGSSNADTVSNTTSDNVRRYQSGSKWSDTNPEINLHHVFEGEINRKGRPTGYHSRPGGVDVDGAKIISIKDGPNSLGVYTATIAVKDGNQWKEKFSSFFPDAMSSDQVIAAILNAYSKSSNKNSKPWKGPSGLGFEIQGYTTSKGGINTAFPLYRGN